MNKFILPVGSIEWEVKFCWSFVKSCRPIWVTMQCIELEGEVRLRVWVWAKKWCFVWARAPPSGSLSASLSNWKMEGISGGGPARWAGGEFQSWEAILFPAASLPSLPFPLVPPPSPAPAPTPPSAPLPLSLHMSACPLSATIHSSCCVFLSCLHMSYHMLGSLGLLGWMVGCVTCSIFFLVLSLCHLSLSFVFFFWGGGEGHIFKSLYVQLKRLESWFSNHADLTLERTNQWSFEQIGDQLMKPVPKQG